MSGLPNVWLLGDSIRMGYQPVVAAALAGRARVVGPAENCQFALYTLCRLGAWFEELGRPDLVHWNNGLHDIGHNPGRAPVQFPLEDYRANLGHVLRALRVWTPKVLWATSTPVHPDRPFKSSEWSWRNEEIDRYGQAARKLMAREKAPATDLHAIVAADPDAMLSKDQLHLSQAGNEACAAAVAKAILAAL